MATPGRVEPGKVMTINFELEGLTLTALNGGPHFKFTEAISLEVDCASQDEVDELWDKLTADGGEPSQCGWLKDKFGLSWQIVPTALMEYDARSRPGRIAARHGGHAQNGQTGSRCLAAGLRARLAREIDGFTKGKPL